jgi:hypothetical protein
MPTRQAEAQQDFDSIDDIYGDLMIMIKLVVVL